MRGGALIHPLAMEVFKEILQMAIDQNVPVRQAPSDLSPKSKTWYPSCIKRAAARKRCLWRQHRADPDNDAIKAAYQAAASKHRQLIYKYELKREQKSG
jgi:hypothetical protein